MKQKQTIQNNNHDIARTHNALYQNAIINGNMEIWQDGTSFAAMASATYIADMWKYFKNGTMVHTGSQDTDTPNDQLNYSLKVDTTTADAAIAAGDYTIVQTYLEGYDFKKFLSKYITISFWVKSVVTGTYCLALRNSGNDRSYVTEYTINTASTWEYKTITILLNETGGTWDYTNGIGLQIVWTLDAGTTYQTTADTWQTGNYFATSNQVNFSASTNNNFWIAGIQLNEGKGVSQWNPRSFEDELRKCQRYYEKSTVTKDDSYVITDSDGYTRILLSGAGANKTFTLPTSLDNTNRVIEFINMDSTYYMIIDGEGTEKLRWGNTEVETITCELQGTGFKVFCDGTRWIVTKCFGGRLATIGTAIEFIYTKFFNGTGSGATINFAHGVTQSQIIAFTSKIRDASNYGVYSLGAVDAASDSYTTYITSTDIYLSGIGANKQNQPYTVFIEYYI